MRKRRVLGRYSGFLRKGRDKRGSKKQKRLLWGGRVSTAVPEHKSESLAAETRVLSGKKDVTGSLLIQCCRRTRKWGEKRLRARRRINRPGPKEDNSAEVVE